MAADPRITNAIATSMADVIATALDSGYLRIYDGTIPTNADTAIGAQTLLAELRFAATFEASNTNGVLTADTITADASANASGTATWARLLGSDGTTVVMDITVGTSGEDLNLNTASITAGDNVSVSSLTITMPKT